MTDNPFTGPQLQNAHHQRADMTGTHFDGVNLANAKFYAVLTGANFTDTNLQAAIFDDVNLSNASFNNITFENTTITFANMSNMKISGITLENTDIQDANLTGMKINGILVTDLLAAYEKPST
jgi:uncharacterized protein YjbI with pentapeptide repeats